MNARLRVLVLCALPAVSALAAIAPAHAAGTKEVSIKDFLYVEETLKADVGDTVTWTNNETNGVPHTVTGDGKDQFDSKIMDVGAKFSHTFPSAGVFTYLCSLHPQMTGKVVVGDAVDAPAAQPLADKSTEEAAATAAPAAAEGTDAAKAAQVSEDKPGKRPGKDNGLGVGIIVASLSIGLLAGPAIKLATLKKN